MKTDITYLWEKHFGNKSAVSLSKSKSFFEELNEICIKDAETEKEVEIKPETTKEDNPTSNPYQIQVPLVNTEPKA